MRTALILRWPRVIRPAALAVAVTTVFLPLARAQTSQGPPPDAASFAACLEGVAGDAAGRGVPRPVADGLVVGLTPDPEVIAAAGHQSEFEKTLWDYIDAAVTEETVADGRAKRAAWDATLAAIEARTGVDRFVLLAIWGIESGYGAVLDKPGKVRPVLRSLATLACTPGDRAAYWRDELVAALRIAAEGPVPVADMTGSWAGAMGHTQWMPEVWLNVGVDFDGDGRISPFGKPDDALAGTANYIVKRGKYRRDEPWGFEARLPAGFNTDLADNKTSRPLSQWGQQGIVTVEGQSITGYDEPARLWLPGGPGGPALLLMHNFYAVRSYNPSSNYALAVLHLGDRVMGEGPFVTPWPGGERALTLAEVQEVQQRLTAAGFNTGGTDGRVGADTMRAVKAFQDKAGISPADGYASIAVLNALRQGR